jgi:hypothetical protein
VMWPDDVAEQPGRHGHVEQEDHEYPARDVRLAPGPVSRATASDRVIQNSDE